MAKEASKKKRRGRRPQTPAYPAIAARIEAAGKTYWQVAGETGIRRIGQKMAGRDRWSHEDIDKLLKYFGEKYETLFGEVTKRG